MTTLDEIYPDLLPSERDPKLDLLVEQLDVVRRENNRSAVPDTCDRVIASAINERLAPPSRRKPGMTHLPVPNSWMRLAASAAALGALVAASTGVYLHMNGATPASAQTILRRAVAAEPKPGDVVHSDSTYRILVQPAGAPSSPALSTYDQWSQIGPSGGVAQASIRYTEGTHTGGLVADDQGNLWTFSDGKYVKSTWTVGKLFGGSNEITFLLKSTVLSPQDPGGIKELLAAAAHAGPGSSTDGMTLLPSQTLDGRQVNVVRITHPIADSTKPCVYGGSAPDATRTTITLYIDSSSYLIRRIEELSTNAQGKTVAGDELHVTTYDIVPLSQVPPGTFTFTPAGLSAQSGK
jgi:hypothetical protein